MAEDSAQAPGITTPTGPGVSGGLRQRVPADQAWAPVAGRSVQCTQVA